MSGDYINRGDILFQLETGFFPQSMEYTEGVAIAKSLIKSAPGVDAVEVVRCKDCRFCEKIENEIIHVWSCYCKRSSVFREVDARDYCSSGEKNNG